MDKFIKKARDPDLIDALDSLTGIQFKGTTWRVTRRGRDPLIGQRSMGRWGDGSFDILYTSLKSDGAIAEIDFVLSSSIPKPSHTVFQLHQISANTYNTLQLIDFNKLTDLGLDMGNYAYLDYQRMQEISDVAYFLDYDGLVVPNARWPCNNLVLFTERLKPEDFELEDSKTIDFDNWRKQIKEKRRFRIVDSKET